MVSYTGRRGQSIISNLTKNTPTYDVKFAVLPVRKIYLDFGIGATGSMLESIIAHSYIMYARDRIANNCEHGSTFKERIQTDKRETGGAIFRNGYSRLGQTIQEVQRERK